VLLVGGSLEVVKQMLADLISECSQVGLEVHLGKTKIMSNGKDKDAEVRQVLVQGNRIEVLAPGGSTLYLGRDLSLTSTVDTEIAHRMSRAWAKFSVYKQELTNKGYSLFDRLRLFNAVVTPSALYGSGSWAMTQSRAQKLRSTQRKMLRTILGRGRRREETTEETSSSDHSTAPSEEEDKLESWTAWIQRTTHEAVDAMNKVGVPDWAEEQQRRKWRWCGHALRRLDGRWTRKVVMWMPEDGARGRGHPCARWEDDIIAFVSAVVDNPAQWDQISQMAADREGWTMLEKEYCKFTPI